MLAGLQSDTRYASAGAEPVPDSSSPGMEEPACKDGKREGLFYVLFPHNITDSLLRPLSRLHILMVLYSGKVVNFSQARGGPVIWTGSVE